MVVLIFRVLRGREGREIRGENRGFARSMASEAMGDILYGEHDSIKHSIKSSLINLTLALGGGRRRDPRGVPPPLSRSASSITDVIFG